MIDQFSEVFYFIKGVIRNKWVVTLAASVICISGWIYVAKMPDIYMSSARVHVDTRTMLRPLLRGLAIQSDVRGLVAIMKKLMFTQQNMIKVAELSGMDVDLNSEHKLHALVKKLKSKVKIGGGRGEIFKIQYESEDPLLAKNVVQAVLTVFSEQTQHSSLSDVDSARRFIDNQIREYEQRLQNAERAKENFKRDNIGLLPGNSGGGQVGAIRAIREKIEVAKMNILELHSRKEVLQLQLTEALDSSDEWGLVESDAGEDASAEDIRISDLNKRRDDILLKYTENHPNIAVLDSAIKALEKRKEESSLLLDEYDDMGDETYEAMSNPYVQTIKVALNTLDAEVASLKSRILGYQKKLKEEDEQFNSRLAIETEIQNLNRDYASIKKNYLSLIDRREQARMARSVDEQVSSLKFKVIDPAHVPETPMSPNRRLLYSLVLAAGFILGIILALVKVFIRPTFVEAKQLRELTEVPVLGVISEVVSQAQIKKNKLRMYRFVFVNTMLLSMYAAIMVLGIKL